jgi:prepilin signal peptidase PulO-like enzyme (type II secretory pathway)
LRAQLKNTEMPLRPQPIRNPKFFIFWCWLWVALGSGSVILGAWLFLTARSQKAPDDSLLFGAWIAVIFGALRIINSLYVLRRMKQRRP